MFKEQMDNVEASDTDVSEEAEAPTQENAEVEDDEKTSSSEEPEGEFSDEEVDEVADTAIDVLRSILSYFDATGAEINEYDGDDGELILDVVGGDLAILIGRRGHTLDAIQTLVSTIVHHRLGFRYPLTIDVESYKERQREKIESMAYSAADRAYRQDRDVSLRPMNPYERRLVHMALRDDERVTTHSEGVDPDRRVIISPAE